MLEDRANCLPFHSNTLKEPVSEKRLPEIHNTERFLNPSKIRPPDEAINSAAEILTDARMPVIIAGNGVRISRAFDGLEALAELLGAPIVTSALG